MSYTKSSTATLGLRVNEIQVGYRTTETTSYQRFFLEKSRTGDVNPDWKREIAMGTQAATPLTAMEEFCKFSPAYATVITERGMQNQIAPYFYDVTNILAGEYIVPLVKPAAYTIDLSKADAQALSRLWSALRYQRSSMQAGVIAGEFGESVRGIGDMAKSLARMFGSHVRQQQKVAARYLGSFVVDALGNPRPDPRVVRAVKRRASTWEKLHKELRDNYLNFALGVRPLVKDAKDLAETVARWQFDQSHTRIRGYGKDQIQLSQTSGKAFYLGILEYVTTTHRYVTGEVIYRAGLYPDYQSSIKGSSYRLYQLLGLYDLENWIPTVWNLLPASFVVDYVTNVADVVTAMVTDTSRIAWVLKTTRRETREDCHGIVPYKRVYLGKVGDKDTCRYQTGTMGGYEYTTRSISRIPQAGLALPELSFNLPQDKGLTIPNLIALFSGKPPPRNYSDH
jgi:hypothetical protein